jgi:curli production assembly/transport component CsgF
VKPLLLLAACLAAPAAASELIYAPTHPAFGGSPLNGSVLLNEANAQNTFKDPASTPRQPRQKSELEKFNDKLQAAVLNRIANSLTAELFDADGNLQPGTIETVDFTITIVDPGDGTLLVTTVDKKSGASSTFEILNPTATP